jgi:hypothetical protein
MKLEIGDVIYAFYSGTIKERIVIERVTNTLAISGSQRFDREYKVYIRRKGDSGFNVMNYLPETPIFKEQWERNKIIEFIKSVKLEELTMETLTKIQEALL